MKIARHMEGHGETSQPASALLAVGSLLAFFLPADRRDDLLADLEEEFRQRAAIHGLVSARGWYIRQILTSLPRSADRRCGCV
jgi:hypothetical protein